jgi:hypothetical protein
MHDATAAACNMHDATQSVAPVGHSAALQHRRGRPFGLFVCCWWQRCNQPCSCRTPRGSCWAEAAGRLRGRSALRRSPWQQPNGSRRPVEGRNRAAVGRSHTLYLSAQLYATWHVCVFVCVTVHCLQARAGFAVHRA